METISIIAIIISIISVFITGLIYINAEKSLKQSQDKYLYELRLNALKITKDVEVSWQTLINDIYHEKERIRKIETNLTLHIKEMFDNVEIGILKPSLENVSKVKMNLEENFDDIDEKEAKMIIRTMEVINIGLRQVQEESIRKYQLLYNELKERSSHF